MMESMTTLHVWRRLHEPRGKYAAQVAAYLVAGVMGCVLLLGRPDALTWQLGHWATIGAGTVVALAGGAGSVAAYVGAWWAERIAILTILLAYVALLPILWAYDTASVTMRLILTLQTLAVAALHVGRWFDINWADFDPTHPHHPKGDTTEGP